MEALSDTISMEALRTQLTFVIHAYAFLCPIPVLALHTHDIKLPY